MNLSASLSLVVLVVVTAGVFVLREAAKRFASDQAGEIVTRLNRAAALQRELESARGEERQTLRFTSYGKLWACMRPLALYGGGDDFEPENVRDLSTKLSNWYFSETGGLLLTAHLREIYFGRQDLLRIGGGTNGWRAHPSDGDHREAFESIAGPGSAAVLKYLDETPPDEWARAQTLERAKEWRKLLQTVATTTWKDPSMSPEQRFAVFQQAGSVLRTAMTKDIDSRIR